MELSLTTFILETINFLALVWILKRLFYQPVKRAIEERRARVAKGLADAEGKQKEANQLKAQYEGRLREWETEKATASAAFEKSLLDEKKAKLSQMMAEVASEREKLRVQDEKKTAEALERTEREAIRQSVAFASRLLEEMASPALDAKLIAAALKRIPNEPPGEFNGALAKGNPICIVHTAFPLSEELRQTVRAAIQARTGVNASVQFAEDKLLISGIEISLGATVLRANLRDELAFFSRVAQS